VLSATSTVDAQNGSGAPAANAQVTVDLTRPNGGKTMQSGKTNSAGQVKLNLKIKQPGAYSARVTKIALSGSTFSAGANDAAGPVTVS
jgi:5-hydroxyisourate hydrolase-like protein (transthyretin family)